MHNKKIKLIDFLRGYSILTIVLFHLLSSYPFPNILQKAFMFGGAGVHVFILCSGFGLYLSYLKKPLTYIQFLRRRFTKIYWPYIIIVLLSALWSKYNIGTLDFKALASHIFLFKMFVEEYECSFGMQMWFISTIIQFYIFWPFILKLFRRNFVMTFLISFTWPLFISFCGLEEYRIYNSFFLQYLWEFVLGMYLARVYYNTSNISIPSLKYLLIGGVIGVFLTGTMGMMGGVWKSFNDIPSLIGYLSVALIIYKLNILLINNSCIFMNKFSYELYLVHILVFSICKYYLNARINIFVEIFICLVLALLIAYFYRYLYNKLSHIKLFIRS